MVIDSDPDHRGQGEAPSGSRTLIRSTIRHHGCPAQVGRLEVLISCPVTHSSSTSLPSVSCATGTGLGTGDMAAIQKDVCLPPKTVYWWGETHF